MRKTTLPLLYFFCFFFNPISNQAQCSPDTQPPLVACEESVYLTLPTSGTLIMLPEFFEVGFSNDNCTATENLTFSVSPATVDCSNIGTPVEVILTVTDEAGNSNSCMSSANIISQLPTSISCYDEVHISLPASGEIILTPELLLFSPSENCGLTYTIVPSSVNCDDIGGLTPYTVTVANSSGNSFTCYGNMVVEDKIGFTIACFADVNVNLPAGGNLTITPEMLLAFHNDNCELTYTVSPSEVDCDDVGSTVRVTLSAVDPGGNFNSCYGDVFIVDPEPSDVAIIPPSSISCGETGLVFNSTVTGGYGPFTYLWVLKKGASTGWVITSGQGTAAITMTAGTGKLKLELKITGICGGKEKDKYKVTPDCGSGFHALENSSFQSEKTKITTAEKDDLQLSIFPNPAKEEININIQNEKEMATEITIFNNFGKKMISSISLPPNENLLKLPVNNFPNGIYFIEIKMDDGKRVVRKFVKQ